MTDGISRVITDFEQAIEGTPAHALNLVAIGELALAKDDPLRALELARKAIAAAAGDAEVMSRATALLGSLLPGYHLPMMNDVQRNTVWDAALRNAVRRGMHVLEIGTGGGMLAMMAARAGAAKVVTCERDPVAAAIAREIVAGNGYGDVVSIVSKRSQEIRLEELDRPADLLFCDIFSDTLVGFNPLPAFADARRLLVPAAPVIPGTGSIRMALGDWADYSRRCHADHAAGFEIAPFGDFARGSKPVPKGDPGLNIRSTEALAFAFDFAAASHPTNGSVELDVEIVTPGAVNGIIQWMRLEFGGGHVLESRPEPGALSFSAPRFHPLAQPIVVRPGDRLRVLARFRGKHLAVWPGWE